MSIRKLFTRTKQLTSESSIDEEMRAEMLAIPPDELQEQYDAIMAQTDEEIREWLCSEHMHQWLSAMNNSGRATLAREYLLETLWRIEDAAFRFWLAEYMREQGDRRRARAIIAPLTEHLQYRARAHFFLASLEGFEGHEHAANFHDELAYAYDASLYRESIVQKIRRDELLKPIETQNYLIHGASYSFETQNSKHILQHRYDLNKTANRCVSKEEIQIFLESRFQNVSCRQENFTLRCEHEITQGQTGRSYLCSHSNINIFEFQNMAIALLDAVMKLHQSGFVYGDLRPETFLFDGEHAVLFCAHALQPIASIQQRHVGVYAFNSKHCMRSEMMVQPAFDAPALYRVLLEWSALCTEENNWHEKLKKILDETLTVQKVNYYELRSGLETLPFDL